MAQEWFPRPLLLGWLRWLRWWNETEGPFKPDLREVPSQFWRIYKTADWGGILLEWQVPDLLEKLQQQGLATGWAWWESTPREDLDRGVDLWLRHESGPGVIIPVQVTTSQGNWEKETGFRFRNSECPVKGYWEFPEFGYSGKITEIEEERLLSYLDEVLSEIRRLSVTPVAR